MHRIAVARYRGNRAPFARLLSAALIFFGSSSTIFAQGLFRKLGQLFILHETQERC
jgi:hypothetical protein